MKYKCECGCEFDNPQMFNGHKRGCQTHLLFVGKEHLLEENQGAYLRQRYVEHFGSEEEYHKALSNAQKKRYRNDPNTFENRIKLIDKKEFIREYIEENKSRSYMKERYHLSDYMLDKAISYFNCHKDKKKSSSLGWQTKYSFYPSDNVNNWKKGHETRVKNSGSLEESYRKGLEKQQKTMLEKYGVACSLNLDFLSNHRRKKDTYPNKIFASLLDRNNIQYQQEFCIELKSYDFKIGDILIEINPTITHNIEFIPFGDYKGLSEDYHRKKTELAMNHGFRCIHVWDWDDINKVIDLLKKRPRIYARNCEVKEIKSEICKEFLSEHHLQGNVNSSIRIGLYYNNSLVSLMTFGSPRYNKNFDIELLRYCSIYQVVGGAEKLFKYFLNTYSNIESVVSYCDESKFTGDIYSRLGFNKIGLSFNKHWYNSKTKKHITDNLLRQRGFDQLLGDQYGRFGKGKNNEELMKEHGFLPIIDSGQATYAFYRKNKSIIVSD